MTNSVLADIHNVQATFEDGLPKGKLNVITVTGGDVNGGAILRRLRGREITDYDAFVFYYSGHGGYDPQKGHYLALTNTGPLMRSDVIDAIVNPKTPRFWAVITDCCASISPVAVAAAGEPTKYIEPVLLKHLLLETTGRLDITSSRPEQVSMCDQNGGTFTKAFCSVLRENRLKRLDWRDVFQESRAETVFRSEGNMRDEVNPHRHNGIEQRVQTPYSFRTMYGNSVNGLRFGIYHDDLVIQRVDQGSPASRAGLRRGMTVLSVNGVSVNSDDQLITAVNFSPRDAEIVVRTGQGRRTFQIELAY
ncbi:MAG: caspase family protein [Planctomycetaceae bacterium]|nr:caspase family protein [Planctomycetaceae bacterium]